MVDENMRRLNTMAVKERDQWRKRYNELANIIRAYKREVKYFDSKGLVALSNKYRIILTALQNEAKGMMCIRDFIAHDLKDTAYKYE